MSKTLIIIGAGGHGKVAAECAAAMNYYHTIEFVDALFPQLQTAGRWAVVSNGEDLVQYQSVNTEFFVAIGDNQTRQKVSTQLLNDGARLAKLIHPRAYVSQIDAIGSGSLVCANAVVNIDTVIGIGNIINTGATVDHDCFLADFVHVAPGAHLAGGVKVGEASFLGIGSVIIQGKSLGKYSVLGAGSTLINDLADNVVAVGSPAKVIKQKQ